MPVCCFVNDNGNLSVNISLTNTILDEPHQTEAATMWPTQTTYGNEYQIRQFLVEIQNGTCKMMSNGSYDPTTQESSSAYLSVNDWHLGGSNIIPGSKYDQSSQRSELGGILGAVLCVNELCQEYHVTADTVELGCNCNNATRSVVIRSLANLNDSFNTNNDIILMITHHVVLKSPITGILKNVEGHQDKHTRFELLDEWGQANYITDKYAKEALVEWQNAGHPRRGTEFIPCWNPMVNFGQWSGIHR